MSVYLDTSVITGLIVERDAFSGRARSTVFDDEEVLVVSDFAAAEFASVIPRMTRSNQMTEAEARDVFDTFDTWRTDLTDSEEITQTDVRVATTIIRRLDLNIRAPDAINLAIARRLGASVATFDRRMADNAGALGIAVAVV